MYSPACHPLPTLASAPVAFVTEQQALTKSLAFPGLSSPLLGGVLLVSSSCPPLLAMGVKAQHLGFLHGCWPSEEVPMRSRHSASETGTLGIGSPVLSAVSVERDVTWVILHLDGTLLSTE